MEEMVNMEIISIKCSCMEFLLTRVFVLFVIVRTADDLNPDSDI